MTEPPTSEQEDPPSTPQGRRRQRRAVRPGVEATSDDARAWEDDDRAWGDPPRNGDRDEDRIRREVPPHWS